MSNGDLMDLQEVMSALGMSEQELQNLVAQGKLKAVRAGRTIKFRREEVMGLKSGRSTEPTIIIPTQEAAPAPQAPQAPAPEPAPAPAVDESAATVVPEAPAGGVVPVETQEISLEDEELEIVPLEDEAAATVAESAPVEAAEEVTVAEEAEERRPSARRSSARSARMSRMSRRVSQVAYGAPPTSPVWAGVLIITTVILLLAATVFGTICTQGYVTEEGKPYVPRFLEWAYSLFVDEGAP